MTNLSIPDPDGCDVGVEADYSPAGGITIYTDAGDTSLTRLSSADARKLANWLNGAADAADAQAAST